MRFVLKAGDGTFLIVKPNEEYDWAVEPPDGPYTSATLFHVDEIRHFGLTFKPPIPVRLSPDVIRRLTVVPVEVRRHVKED